MPLARYSTSMRCECGAEDVHNGVLKSATGILERAIEISSAAAAAA